MSNKKTKLLSSPEETIAFGAELATCLTDGRVVALYGELGVGKTTLAKGLISALTGVSCNEVTSPTFQYVAIYESPRGRVYHFDLWRLKNECEFLAAGFEEFLTDGIAIIEWPERIQRLLPSSTVMVHIESVGGTRSVSTQGVACRS